MRQYLEACKKIINEGTWITNDRTGVRCLTLINLDFEYDVGAGEFPLVTTRKAYWKSAIAELFGYLRGCSSAAEFRALGTKTWDANANLNKEWLKNPSRKGTDSLGRIYGTQGRDWTNQYGQKFDQLNKIIGNLSAGIDDRGEILSFWNPGEFHLGALRPCMYEHQFSLVDDTLYLNSTQRSCDMPLGYVANAVQCYVLLLLVSHITGHKAGKVFHKVVNAHIYENQLELLKEQIERQPYELPTLFMDLNRIKSLEDVECVQDPVSAFALHNYKHHEPINFPFTV